MSVEMMIAASDRSPVTPLEHPLEQRHHGCVQAGEQRGQRDVDERPADEVVDLVEVIAGDGDADRDRDEDESDRRPANPVPGPPIPGTTVRASGNAASDTAARNQRSC